MNTEQKEVVETKAEDLETQTYDINYGIEKVFGAIANWFLSLSLSGKIITGFLGFFFALSLMRMAFSLFRLGVSITVFGLIIYFVSRIFTKENTIE